MKIVNTRMERLQRALDAKLRPAMTDVRMGRAIPAEKVFRDLKARSRLRAKLPVMPKPYTRKTSLPRGYLFDFKDARGIGVPRSLTLV
jgi:hypothetical protein